MSETRASPLHLGEGETKSLCPPPSRAAPVRCMRGPSPPTREPSPPHPPRPPAGGPPALPPRGLTPAPRPALHLLWLVLSAGWLTWALDEAGTALISSQARPAASVPTGHTLSQGFCPRPRRQAPCSDPPAYLSAAPSEPRRNLASSQHLCPSRSCSEPPSRPLHLPCRPSGDPPI